MHDAVAALGLAVGVQRGLTAATRRVAAHGPKAYQKRMPNERRPVIVSPHAASSRA
jgi:hypothetical protein